MSEFVKAYPGQYRATIYEDSDGPRIVRSNGSPAWRNNNPGNIVRSAFADRYGAIGDDGHFAIFPSYKTGRAALEALLNTNAYQSKTIEQAMHTYAPSSENNTNQYVEFLEKNSGIDRTRVLGRLPAGQYQALINAIERYEGTTEGKTFPIPSKKPVVDATGRMIRD